MNPPRAYPSGAHLPHTGVTIPHPPWYAHRMLTDRDSLLRQLHELRSEHRDLDTVIARLAEAGTDQLHMVRLKKRKLLLKDEIAWLESRLIPDNIA